MGGQAVPKVEMPSLAQVRELPELVRHVVPPEWEDLNGHVNVQHYTALYDMSGYPFMDMMGITAEQVRETRVGMFDLEHHIWFLDEMHVGDVVTGHACIVERGPKRVLSVMFIVDETRERLASVLEVVSTTADLDARVEVIKRRDAFDRDPEGFTAQWAAQDMDARKHVERARKKVDTLKVPDAVLRDAARLCSAVGTDGVRGELALLRGARALAAYEGARHVATSHLRTIAPSALRHRLRRNVLDDVGSTVRIERAITDVLGDA